MTRRTLIISTSLAVVAAGAGAAALATAQPAQLECTVQSLQAASPAGTTILSAEHLDKPVGHCRIDGWTATAKPGETPGPGRAGWRLQLPDRQLFKGRYYFIGLGGGAGFVPTTSQIPAGNPIVKGFVVAGTDTGREGRMGDWSFMSDPVIAEDNTHRAAHVTAVVTQALAKQYYGVNKLWRYHSGCSGGGRMGEEAASRHPEDFDGILIGQSSVGPPGMPDGTVFLKMIHESQQMAREPGAWLSPAKLRMIDKHVTAACDMLDGAKDGIVWDHNLCHYDVAKLKCKAGDRPDCLTQPEITTFKNIIAGPRGPKGELLAYPMPITNVGTAWPLFTGQAGPPWPAWSAGDKVAGGPMFYSMGSSIAVGYFGPQYKILTDFNFKNQKDIDAWVREAGKNPYGETPPLEPMEKTGGKIILWAGEGDPCCSSNGMRRYIDYLDRKWKDPARVNNFIRFYSIPGLGHCAGGTGPVDPADRLFETLVAWVEQGKTPKGVVMHSADRAPAYYFGAHGISTDDGTGRQMAEAGIKMAGYEGVSRDFLVCPYPQKSTFDTSKAGVPGAVYEAKNWSCRGK